MQPLDYVLLAVIGLLVLAALAAIRRQKARGKGCLGGSSCPSSCTCPRKRDR